jgi:hypothetical protein
MTVIAQQNGHELQPYETKTGDQILIVELGRHSIGELFSAQQKQHSLLSWFVRASCVMLIFSGCSYITAQVRPWGMTIFNFLNQISPRLISRDWNRFWKP